MSEEYPGCYNRIMTDVGIFAVEDTSAQVCWRGLRPGATISLGDASVEVQAEGPGAATLEGLPPATHLELFVRPAGTAQGRRADAVRTLSPPPGELLCRFATVNDLHLGERSVGLARRLRDRPGTGLEPYPLLCARAALTEAVAWGAEAIVAKGDLTYHGRPQQWSDLGRLLAGIPVSVSAVLGNHDVGIRAVDGRPVLAASGIVVPYDPFSVDLPGLRVVLAHTAVAHKHHGAVVGRQRDQIADLVAAAPGPVFLAMHHYVQRFKVPMAYPPGIPGDQSRALLDTVLAANPATMLSAGHSHRNRRRRYGPLVITEVGATMHYPGTWAGYAVHEGGIRQVVRRVAAPDAIAWTDRTRRILFGLWGAIAPGPAFLAVHHYAQRYRRALAYPPGLPGDEGRALLDTVAEANPATFVSTGHSHRNRRRYHGPLVVTQVGATMHYPGTWAGYAVHEGGIRQVVRRVAAPEAIGWTDRTRRGAGGVWGVIAPGLRSHRCFSHTWPPR